MAEVVNIVLVENIFLLRSGIESLVNELPGILMNGVFEGNEKNLHEKIKKLKPQIVIIDPDSLRESFIELTSNLQQDPDIKIIGLLKQNCPDNIKSRFKQFLYISNSKYELQQRLQKIAGKRSTVNKNEKGPLSKREIIILKEVVKGMTNQEIADKLFLSIHTVMTHRKNIIKKIGIKTVSGLTVYALMNNIVEMNEIK